MNKPLILICLGLLAFLGWREKATLASWKNQSVAKIQKFLWPHENPVAEEDTPSETPEPVAKDAPSAAAVSTAQKPPDNPPVPAPVEKITAELPPNVYFLRERVTIPSDAGIRGYDAGLQVTATREKNGILTVTTEGKSTFSVPALKLTRDLNEVKNLQQAKLERETSRLTTPSQSPPPSATKTGNADDAGEAAAAAAARKRAELRGTLAEIDRQLNEYRIAVYNARVQQGKGRAAGRISAASASTAEYEKKIKALEAQRNQVSAQFSALR